MTAAEKKSHAYLWLALIVLVYAAIRLFVADRLHLSPDEAYYWSWSRLDGPCYPDHPPLVARLIELGVFFLGDTSAGVRLPAVVFGEIHLLLMYVLLRELELSRAWSVAGAAVNGALPIVSAGSVIITPDAPLGLAWSSATVCLVILTRRQSSAAWVGLTLAFCFAFLAKLSALLIPVVGAATFAVSPRLRRDARTAAPYVSAALGGLFVFFVGRKILSCPHVQTQLDHLSGRLVPIGADVSFAGAPLRILELLAGQAGLLTPLLAWFAARGLVKYRQNPAVAALGLSFGIPLVATMAAALSTHPEQNWASLGHPALAAAAFFYLAKIPAARSSTIAAAALVFASFAAIHVHALWTVLPLPSRKDPISRLHGWSRLDYLVKDLRKHGVVLSDDYGLAAQIVWNQRRHPAILRTVVAMDRAGPPGRADAALIVAPCDIDGECRADSTISECESFGNRIERSMYRADGRPARTICWRMGYGCRFERGFRLVSKTKRD